MINKDTRVYCSFSKTPGNNGCLYFNEKFKQHNINAIYKSFYSDNIEQSVLAAKILGFSGFAISMPYKQTVLKCVDSIDECAIDIGAANTIVNVHGTLYAYNTDWIGVYLYLKSYSIQYMNILGNGGFSRAVQYACNKLNITYDIIDRSMWSRVGHLDGYTFNATPIDVQVNGILIDGKAHTDSGKQIALLQADEQFKIYSLWM